MHYVHRSCACLQAAAASGLQQGLPPDKRVSDAGLDMNGHSSGMQQAQQYDNTTQQIIVSVTVAMSCPGVLHISACNGTSCSQPPPVAMRYNFLQVAWLSWFMSRVGKGGIQLL